MRGVDWLAALGKRLTLDDYRREKGPARPRCSSVQVWWLWRWGHQVPDSLIWLSDQSKVFISRESQLRHRPLARCDTGLREFFSPTEELVPSSFFFIFLFVVLYFSPSRGMMIVSADDEINTASPLSARRWRKIQCRCASAHLPVKVPSTPRAVVVSFVLGPVSISPPVVFQAGPDIKIEEFIHRRAVNQPTVKSITDRWDDDVNQNEFWSNGRINSRIFAL